MLKAKVQENYNAMKSRVRLLKKTVTIDAEANRVPSYSFVAEVWAAVEIKPRFITRDTLTERILSYSITIRKRALDFDAVEIDGRLLVLKLPPYSDEVYSYIQGEVAVNG